MSATSVLDSHLHVWRPDRLRYPWLDGDERLNRDYGPEQWMPGSSGVDSIVFVQADCLPQQGLDEVDWVQGIADRGELPIDGIVGFAPIEHAAHRSAWLDALATRPRVVGVRRLLQDEPPEFLEHPDLPGGLVELAFRGLTFDAGVRWNQLDALGTLLRTSPGTRVVIDHLGKPPLAAGWDSAERRAWADSIRALAALPGVHVKLSGLGDQAPPDLDLDVVAPAYLGTVLDAFGPKRCMVGSDWPVSITDRADRSYEHWFALVLDGLGLAGDEREFVAAGTARAFYGIGRPGL